MAKPPAYTGPRFQRRKHWLGVLVKENGGPKAVGLAVETPDTHITAMCNGNRGVGDLMADRLEKKFGKTNGWMDQPIQDSPPVNISLADALDVLAVYVRAADKEVRADAADMLNIYLRNPVANEAQLVELRRRLSGEIDEEVVDRKQGKQEAA